MTAPTELAFQHLHTGVFDADLADFGAKLQKKLDDIVRKGGEIIHISCNTVPAKDGALHVGHIVFMVSKEAAHGKGAATPGPLNC